MTPKAPDPFANAKCRSDDPSARTREHHASNWDYSVDGETPVQARRRRLWAQGQCFACEARMACRALHAYWTKVEYPIRQPGIWGGRIISDYEPAKTPDPAQAALFGDDIEEEEAA